MESFGHERQVQQGEDWNLDITLSASDKEPIPFIISSERANPFFVITVASTKFEKNLRYVKSWWNKVDEVMTLDINGIPVRILPTPKFYQTVPQNFGEVYNYVDEFGEEEIEDYTTLLPISPDNYETYKTRKLYQYTLASEKVDPILGHKPYHYFYFEYDVNGNFIQRLDSYECHVRQNFSSKDTSEWGGQNYQYQITLVTGKLMKDFINTVYETYKDPLNPKSLMDWPLDEDGKWETTVDTTQEVITARYNYIKTRWPNEFQPDIDATSPLGYIEIPEPVLRPTKLEVFNNLRTIL